MNETISSQLNLLFDKIKNNNELEFMFNAWNVHEPVSLTSYKEIIKYLKYRNLNDKLKLNVINNLDISYGQNRITIDGIDNINSNINNFYNRNSSVIFSLLCTKILNKDENITIINKVKDSKNKIDFNDYEIRLRLSEENNLDLESIKKLSKLKDFSEEINFRFKQRLNLEIVNNEDYKISIDVTEVKNNKNIKNILKENSNFEVELELMVKNEKKTKSKKRYY